MNKNLCAIAVLILLLGCLWLGHHETSQSKTSDRDHFAIEGQNSISDTSPAIRTKVSKREPIGLRATHAPQQLKDFMLPEVIIDGLTLSAALDKLTSVYVETCGKTGEIPLKLTFHLSPGHMKKLKLVLCPQSLSSSIQLLATYSGIKVSRNNKEFRFEPFPSDRTKVDQAIQVVPGLASRLSEQAGLTTKADSVGSVLEEDTSVGKVTPVSLLIGDILKASGFELDPSTQLSLSDSGSLKLETNSAADAAMIVALAGNHNDAKPIQHKFTSKVIEIPAGIDWTPPDAPQLTDPQLRSLMLELAEKNEIHIMTFPSITARSGQQANIEIIREFVVPTDTSRTSFESHDIGKVVQITGNSLGFGHDTKVRYTDTISDFDQTGENHTFPIRTDLANSGYTHDGGAQLIIQSRPDGSKTVFIITSQLIDATGQPVH